MVAAVVLAAGAGTRMGGRKALVRLGGATALERIVKTLAEAGVDRIQIVVGAERETVAAAVPRPAHPVPNPLWERGRTGSLKAGIRSVPGQEDLLVWPVDHPLVAVSTLRRLLAANEGQIRVPTFQGRRAHPTWFSASLRDELLVLGDDQPLHDVLRRDPGRVTEVPVEDPGVLLNVDTPDDLKKAEAYLRESSDARPAS